jgi:thiamine biosynthesis lipoprotein
MDALLSPRRRSLLLAGLGAAAVGAGCARQDAKKGVIRLAGATMGSTWSVRMAGWRGPEQAARGAVTAAFDRVVALMSSFEPGSELARLNRHVSTAPFPISPETAAVLARAQQVALLTAGAFDVTVAPLVAAWGFGAGAAARGGAPDAALLAAQATGWDLLVVEERAVRKLNPHLTLDLSGIAKGYAVDRAAMALEALGVERYLVEAGGEVRTRGRNAEGRPWQVAIEKPDVWPQQVQRVVPLEGLSIATSGDYRNFYALAGRRVHHEIDPATRAPAAHALASASVVHGECMSADALATALYVMGPERGPACARERGLAAHFIVREAGALREIATPALLALAAEGVGA